MNVITVLIKKILQSSFTICARRVPSADTGRICWHFDLGPPRLQCCKQQVSAVYQSFSL
jgi:hypothetical protein